MNCPFLSFCGKVSSDGGETKQRSVGFDTTISSEHTGIPLWLTKCYCATVLPEKQLSVLGVPLWLTKCVNSTLYTPVTDPCNVYTLHFSVYPCTFFSLATVPETQPSVLGIPVYPSDWPNATVLQLLLYQRHKHQFCWAYSWLTKYNCTLYTHVTATVLLAQSSGGIPMWMTKYYCSGVQLLPLLLCYRHCHLFSACPVLTTVTVLWKENNLLLHHNPWYLFYCYYISIAHEQYVGIANTVLVGNCMVAYCPTIPASYHLALTRPLVWGESNQ